MTRIVAETDKIWWLNSNFDYELYLERFGCSVVFWKIMPAKMRLVASYRDCEGGKQKVSSKERRHDAGGDIILLPLRATLQHFAGNQTNNSKIRISSNVENWKYKIK